MARVDGGPVLDARRATTYDGRHAYQDPPVNQHAPLNVTIRRSIAADEGYIAATWRRSALGARSRRSDVERRRSATERQIRRMMERGELLVAEDPSTPDLLLGWICTTRLRSTAIVHYVYVRDRYPGSVEPLRRRGLGRQLAVAAGVNLAAPIPFTIAGPDVHHLARFRPYPIAPEEIP